MHFTVDRLVLAKMVELLTGKAGGRKKTDSFLQLTAAGARVFVEANGMTCGVEALVMREGSCRLPRMKFSQVLKTFHPKANLTAEADARGFRIDNFAMGHAGFTSSATAPGQFQEFPITDTWLAGAEAPKPPSANVPSAAPDESSPRSAVRR